MMIRNNIWLIGTGLMSEDYANVLINLDCDFITIGRGQNNCDNFKTKFGKETLNGGLDQFLASSPKLPAAVIVSVGIESLSEVCHSLLDYGVRLILLEKPGVGNANEIIELASKCINCNANVYLAYNRRFYSSVLKAREYIEEDGGVTSFNFEFTEWSHVISNLAKHKTELNNWFLGNSTHVIDTAFFLSGKPTEICTFHKGSRSLDWHPASSIFSGAGETSNGALFSYQANWEAPGRWGIEILTKKRRLIFKPLETLQIQEIGSVSISDVELDNKLDISFKPGLYLQTVKFLDGDFNDFCSIQNQLDIMNVYCKMSGYTLK
jgi:predicted dehydrogenase